MKSIDWLLNELKIQKKVFFSSKKTRDIVETRWVAMWFYRLSGKSYLEIGREVRRDHTTVLHGCKTMDVTLKNLAEELLMKYASEVSKTGVTCQLTEKPKVTIKVPDYKHSQVVLKEVDFDQVNKPIKRISKWEL